VFGGPDLPFGLGRGGSGALFSTARREGYDDEGGYGAGVSSGTAGGLGTAVALALLYLAHKQGASPYTLMMLANMLGLTGGRRRGYGGFGGMPYGMGGMRGRRGFF
jgi:hypothetical protein